MSRSKAALCAAVFEAAMEEDLGQGVAWRRCGSWIGSLFPWNMILLTLLVIPWRRTRSEKYPSVGGNFGR